MTSLYNPNDIDPLNEFWDFLNRQFSGSFKLGTFVKSVSDVANAALPLAGGTVTGDIVLSGAGIYTPDEDSNNSQDLDIDVGSSNSGDPGVINIGTTNAYEIGLSNPNGYVTVYSDLDMNSNSITGLADGNSQSDAVNVKQLEEASAHIYPFDISLADMQALPDGVKTISVSTPIPPNARIVQSMYTLVLIDNVGDTAHVGLKAGIPGNDDGILAFVDCTTGSAAALGPAVANGADVNAIMPSSFDFGGAAGDTITLTITATENLNTMTKGSISLKLLIISAYEMVFV
jgi:hypothetical protein